MIGSGPGASVQSVLSAKKPQTSSVFKAPQLNQSMVNQDAFKLDVDEIR